MPFNLRVTFSLLVLFFQLLMVKAQSVHDSIINNLDGYRENERAAILLERASQSIKTNISLAEAYSALAIKYARQNKQSMAELEALMLLGDCGYNNGDYATSTSRYFEALHIAEAKNQPDKVADLHIRLGLSLSHENLFEDALHHLNKALFWADEQQNYNHKATILQHIGMLFWQKGDYAEALLTFNKALELYAETNNAQGKQEALKKKAIALRDMGDYPEAEKILNELLEDTNKSASPLEYAAILNLKASVSWRKSNIDKAHSLYEEAYNLIVKNGDASAAAKASVSLALACRDQGNYKQALEYYTRARKLFEKEGNLPAQANLHKLLGGLYLKMTAYGSSLESYITSLKLYEQVNDKKGAGEVLLNTGNLYRQAGNNLRAKQHYNNALRYFTEAGILNGILNASVQLAHTYQVEDSLDMAEQMLNQAQEISEQNNNKQSRINILLNIASLKKAQHKIPEATKVYLMAIDEALAINNISTVAYAYNFLGSIYQSQNDNEKAMATYASGISFAEKANNKLVASHCYRKTGNIEFARGNVQDARKHYEKAMDIAMQTNNEELQKLAYYALYHWNVKQNEHARALVFYKKYAALLNKLDLKKNDQKLLEIQMNNELVEKDALIMQAEQNLALSEQENQIQQLRIERQTELRNFLFILILLLFVIGLLIYFQYRTKRRNNLLLQEKIEIITEINGKLAASEKELQKLNATKDKFFSIIAHDIKNSLVGIISISRIFGKDFARLSEKEIHEFSSVIHNGAKQLYTLLENLLHWARSQTGKIAFNPEYIDIAEITAKTASLLELNAKQKNIAIKVTTDETVKAFADEDMITLVIRNLISNAIKYTPKDGRIDVIISTNNDTARVEVKDTGIGMDEKSLQRLFKIDDHFSTRGTDNEEGTGLGLILCHEFISKNYGKIHAESKVNQGTSFIFTVPEKPLD